MKKTEVECCDTFCIHEELVHKAEGHIPDEEVLKDLADFFKVFADTTRIRILCVLFQSEMCVCDLAEVLGMTQSAICLLYTSPSPRDPKTSRMPSSA